MRIDPRNYVNKMGNFSYKQSRGKFFKCARTRITVDNTAHKIISLPKNDLKT